MLQRSLRFLILLAVVCHTTEASAVCLDFPRREAALVGIYVKDLRTGLVVEEENARMAFTPASVMKTLTSAAALLELGEDFRFATRFSLCGNVNGNGVVTGDLLVWPDGDPTLGSRYLKSNPAVADSVASRLRTLGVRSLLGAIRLPHGNHGGIVEKWEVEDIDWAYGTGCYLFNYRDNALAQRDPESGKLQDFSNPDPWDTFRSDLTAALRREGISVEERGPEGSDAPTDSLTLASAMTFYTHYSPRSIDILTDLLHRSDNLFAEGMLRALSPSRDLDEALAKERELVEGLGVDLSTAKIYDGSGLSRPDLLPPATLGMLLEKMASTKVAREYVGAFPLVGRDGTVKNMFRRTPLEGRLALKSGSMSGVSCYAGYALDRYGRPTHVIVVMVNNFFCKRAELRGAIEKHLARLLAQ